MAQCRHCNAREADAAWKLCRACYRKAYRAQQDTPGTADTTPTTHLPGSVGKLDVLQERAKQKRGLFHPGDTGHDLQ